MEDGYCYYASPIEKNLDDAVADCRQRGSELVSIHRYWVSDLRLADKFVDVIIADIFYSLIENSLRQLLWLSST
jgi:hypothetical protein